MVSFCPPRSTAPSKRGLPRFRQAATHDIPLPPRPRAFAGITPTSLPAKTSIAANIPASTDFCSIEPRDNPGRYDQEIFLALHDWDAALLPSADGAMDPAYNVSTINGRVLGFGEPLRVKAGQQVLFQILNSSPTEVHWIALAGHSFRVIALDGNKVAQPQLVPMLRLAPAERVTALVEMNRPGAWIMGEVRKHVMAAGMGIAVEYAGSSGRPRWEQPDELSWDYLRFAASDQIPAQATERLRFPLSLHRSLPDTAPWIIGR